jgi:hypothetical protein
MCLARERRVGASCRSHTPHRYGFFGAGAGAVVDDTALDDAAVDGAASLLVFGADVATVAVVAVVSVLSVVAAAAGAAAEVVLSVDVTAVLSSCF